MGASELSHTSIRTNLISEVGLATLSPMLRAALFITMAISGASAGFVSHSAADTLEAPECVAVSKSTPYRGYGYAHIVTLRSTCEENLSCRVSTDVTSDEVMVDLASGQSSSVTTRVGSPASTFEAFVACEEN